MNAGQLEDLEYLGGAAALANPPGIALDGAVHLYSCRLLMGTCSALTLAAAVLLLVSEPSIQSVGAWAPAALSLFISLLGLLGLWLAPPARCRSVVTLLMALVLVLAVTVAMLRHQGLDSITLGLMGLMVALTTALNGLRLGLLMAGFSLLLLTGMAGL